MVKVQSLLETKVQNIRFLRNLAGKLNVYFNLECPLYLYTTRIVEETSPIK